MSVSGVKRQSHSRRRPWRKHPKNCCHGLLRDVSRSFYLTLRVLPGKVRTPIGLAYLLARTTDTIADTELVAPEQRLEALRALRERIQGRREAPLDFGALARQQGSRAEGVLLEKCEASLALLRSLPPADAQLVREVLDTITSGQELDLRRFAGASAESLVALRTDEELDDYTYRVAGCVGEFWTRMCRAHLFPQAPVDDAFLLANGVRFGKGLQLVNILRDVAADLRQGRCYLPAERLAALGPETRRPAAAGERAALASALPRVSRPRRSPPAGGLGLHQRPAAPQRARAAGLRLADPDRLGDPEAVARRQCARPGAANQGQPAPGPAAHAAVGLALSLAGGMGKDGAGRESCCVARRFAVKRPPCRFQNASWSSARRRIAWPSCRSVRLTPTQTQAARGVGEEAQRIANSASGGRAAIRRSPPPAQDAALRHRRRTRHREPVPGCQHPPAPPPPPADWKPRQARRTGPAPQPVNPESIDKARETLHQQMTELETQPPAATAPLPFPRRRWPISQPGQKPVEAKAQETAGKPQVQPKAGEGLKKPAKGAHRLHADPGSASGRFCGQADTRLAELLRKYKADEITPEEYHQQRAKILSEP